ncbi:MAG: GHMP kinase [Gaiellales bacterium]|jgi:D-glycero-alpha-D-manno-heptose-7-phosphate kinase
MNIRARAPLRISFAGGGTDVPPFPEREGGVVLNATIDRYVYGMLRPRRDRRIRIESADFGVALSYGVDETPMFDGKLDLVKAAIREMGDSSAPGYDLFLHSNAPPGSGLGSSSTVMVTLIGLLKEYHNLTLTDYEIAGLSHRIERIDLGLLGGMQDQYAATFGGFNYIEFDAGRVIVNQLRMADEVVHELEHNMLLCYTGATRRSDGIIEDQTRRLEEGGDTLEALRSQKHLAVDMKNALQRRQLNEFADLLDQAWQEKKRMSPKITTGFIDEAYAAARKAGALGGKVTGAGGGGYMLFYCEFQRKHRVAEVLTRMGGQVTEFAFEHKGLTTWSLPDG